MRFIAGIFRVPHEAQNCSAGSAAAAAFILLAMATFRVHMPNGFFNTNGGYEYAMLWGFLMLAIMFRGGGALSLDARLGREL